MSDKSFSKNVHSGLHPKFRGFGVFRKIGPGMVTGAADDDPSGIGTYSQVGAAFGFRYLWVLLLCYPFAVAVQEATARLAIATQKGLSTLVRERYSKPVLLGAIALVVFANTFNIAADIGAMAESLGFEVPVPRWGGSDFVRRSDPLLGVAVPVQNLRENPEMASVFHLFLCGRRASREVRVARRSQSGGEAESGLHYSLAGGYYGDFRNYDFPLPFFLAKRRRGRRRARTECR